MREWSLNKFWVDRLLLPNWTRPCFLGVCASIRGEVVSFCRLALMFLSVSVPSGGWKCGINLLDYLETTL
jgi:hypothetical protein